MGYRRRSTRYGSSADTFENYRDLKARFDSDGGCGHAIKKGEWIGLHVRTKKTQCAACWDQWKRDYNSMKFDEMMCG